MLVLVQACGQGTTQEYLGPPSQPNSQVRLSVVPRSARVALGDSVGLVAFGHFANGDSTQVLATWSSRTGVISSAGLYRALREGTDTVRAVSQAQPSLSEMAKLDIVHPLELAVISLTPDAAMVSKGASIQFTAHTTFPDGSETGSEIIWSSLGGTISPVGLFTANVEPGTYQVTAQIKGRKRSGSTQVTVGPATLDGLQLNPSAVTLAAGESRQFLATPTWSDGSTKLPAVRWSATGGSVSSSGLYTAGQAAGAFQVIVASLQGDHADTSAVQVSLSAPTLSTLILTPAAVALVPGATAQFTVAGSWSDGSAAVPAVAYSATGGTITAGGLYTAGTTPGTYRVIATQQTGTKADTSLVTIAAPAAILLQLVLNPSALSLLPGELRQLAVSGSWSDGSTTTPPVAWTATGGLVTAGGLYTAGVAPGAYRVIATHLGGTRADTAAVTIAVSPPTLTQLVLTPASLTLLPSGTGQFTVTGSWSDGSTSTPAVTYLATGGAITAGGLYTAGSTPGSFRVIAIQQGGTKADTSTVTISAPLVTLLTLALNPSALTLAPGATQQFTVAGTWSDGSTTVPTATYAATGGTITASGLYTAGVTPGTFRVIATHQGGTKADTSGVTVSTPPATSLALVVQPGGALSGAPLTPQPVVELRDAQNKPVLKSGVVVTASKASGTGVLGGALSATTSAQGRATFAGLQITGTGAHTIGFAAAGLTGVTSVPVTPATATLRALATARGFQIGAAVKDAPFNTDAQYRQTLATQYNSIVPEDATDFYAIHASASGYNFGPADALVNFAQANGMTFHGHTLVWYHAIPPWVTNSGFTATQVRALLKDHIMTVVGRYKGKAVSWDVVNEPINNQGCFSSNCGLVPSFWLTHLGPEYIDSAFVWAHRADPAAKLYLNDFRTETIMNKSDAVLALAQGLKARGIPIHGVGFQVHILQQFFAAPTSAQVQANFQRFADAGFDIRITEMDVALKDTDGAAELAAQATIYDNILKACLNVSRCKELTTWGFSDRSSWIPISWPGYGRGLPFDSNYQPKPAFNALLTRLGQP